MKTRKTTGCLGLLAIAVVLVMGGCENNRTVDGKSVACAGILKETQPGYKYEASVRNIVIGGIFSGTLFVPIIVALNEYECPTAKVVAPR